MIATQYDSSLFHFSERTMCRPCQSVTWYRYTSLLGLLSYRLLYHFRILVVPFVLGTILHDKYTQSTSLINRTITPLSTDPFQILNSFDGMLPFSAVVLLVNDVDVIAVRSSTILPKHVAIVYVQTKATELIEIRTHPRLETHGCIVAYSVHESEEIAIFRIQLSKFMTKSRHISKNMGVSLASPSADTSTCIRDIHNDKLYRPSTISRNQKSWVIEPDPVCITSIRKTLKDDQRQSAREMM